MSIRRDTPINCRSFRETSLYAICIIPSISAHERVDDPECETI